MPLHSAAWNHSGSGKSSLIRMLALAGLGPFASRLDQVATWDRILSEGEKQRLAIARLLLHRADIVALDEATSALHVQGQADLMATIISVGHRPELEAYHDRKLTIARRIDGAVISADQPIRRGTGGRRVGRRCIIFADTDCMADLLAGAGRDCAKLLTVAASFDQGITDRSNG